MGLDTWLKNTQNQVKIKKKEDQKARKHIIFNFSQTFSPLKEQPEYMPQQEAETILFQLQGIFKFLLAMKTRHVK